MKAAFLVKKGKAETAFEIRETPVPEPKPDEVLVKVEAFGLNYAEIMARHGLYRDAPPIPCVLGYEVVGTINSVGSGVDKNIVGQRVVAFTRFGGYAEYAITPFEGLAFIGDLDAGLGCCIATQYVTAWYMAEECVRLNKGDKVLVHAGAGGVGTALIQLCKRRGCEVFATAGSNDKLKYMREQGADHVINYKASDYPTEIRKVIGSKKLDVVFNAIGGKTFRQDLRLVGPGGKLVLFGGAARSGKKWGILSSLRFVWQMGFVIPIALMMMSKSIIGVNMLKIADHRRDILGKCLKDVSELVLRGELKPHVGGQFSANEIAKAHQLLESRNSLGKVVVYWAVKN
jgi:NADPH2:quinone reductase